ncbi:TlpA family protein disulfide reductase [Candidatus Oscillochloris fontis]|uniref:TlpA family protein disulfide reductase n=1 Tax=Candidatus Oscillochloris fontis TaxID=2496868 RepID=UPI00101CC904|nr:TlpA disulfide reductase family protein [Candidatus Oscillochloris fontis]
MQPSHSSDRRPNRGRSVKRGSQKLPVWMLPALVIFGVVGLVTALMVRPAANTSVANVTAEVAPEVGKLAPTFSLSTPDGRTINLADLRGQVVLVNFWATWCPPCRAEMPAIQAAYATYQPQGFTVLAVTANAQPADVSDFFRVRGLSFAPLLDDGRVHTAYRANGLPASFFIDRQGVVRAVHHGAMSEAVITQEVERLLGM